MIRDIRKYIIVLLAAYLTANIFGAIIGFIPGMLGVDLNYHAKIFKFGIPAYNLLIRLTIALIARQDMKTKNEKINYFILLLILVDEYAGVGFYLLTRFFTSYNSINLTSDATKD